MGSSTAIAWTDHTFNPWMGCHKVSDGCKHCYAEALVKRNWGEAWGLNAERKLTKGPWKNVLKWNNQAQLAGRPAMVFTASLADVFEDHKGPNQWRNDVFELMRVCKFLDFQILTKRPENIARMLPDDWGRGWPNVWLGTSIEDMRVADRAATLTEVPAIVHFISYEPALGPLDGISLAHVEWLICGGESGPDFRPMDLDWARAMRVKCAEWHTAFFFKQNSAPRTEMGIDALGKVIRFFPPRWDRFAPFPEADEPWAVKVQP